MRNLITATFLLSAILCGAQTLKNEHEERLIRKILAEPSKDELSAVLADLRSADLHPRKVLLHDSIRLANGNTLFVLSHEVGNNMHYGAIIIPPHHPDAKLPVIVFATGGDGMHKEFDIAQDFNHQAVQYPNFLGGSLDQKFVVVIPSFRGQQLIAGGKKYQSEGELSDAFGGATTDALSLLNVVLFKYHFADDNHISIYGGSRGGTVALLASIRDTRIKKTIAVAAPTDMKALYQLYPQQFKLLFFNDLLAGRITEAEARKKFISISPVYFAKELINLQLHHDSEDPFVPVAFANKLVTAIELEGNHADVYYYNEGIHGFWSDENYWTRVQTFLLR